jgi:DeoR/GlpR family transcriptional regulator of sugar metabolism
MDRSKVGVTDFAKICEPRDIDIIVTDYASDDLKRICRDHDVKLEEASAQPGG